MRRKRHKGPTRAELYEDALRHAYCFNMTTKQWSQRRNGKISSVIGLRILMAWDPKIHTLVRPYILTNGDIEISSFKTLKSAQKAGELILES